MAKLFGKMFPKDKNKKHKVSGNAKAFFKMIIPHTVAGAMVFGTVILIILSIVGYISEYSADKNYSQNNPELLYEMLGSEDLNEVICVAGNEEDGYYLAFKQGYEERLEEIIEKYNSHGDYINMDIELLADMIKAELYTQYPNLGGKIGKEADIELEEPAQEESTDEEEEEEEEEKTENIMDIPEMFQNDGVNVTFPSHPDSWFPGTGCGPACIAMVMSYLTGEDVSFQDVASWCDKPEFAGRYFNGRGSNGPIFAASAEHWDVGEVTYTDDPDKVVQSLLDGKPVVSLQTGGIFANVQHYIVLRGVDANGRIYVNNPNRGTAQDENYDMASQIDATSSGYWIYENGTPSSKSSVPKLILANNTGEGQEGFQGAIRIRRVMPNKGIGELKNVGSGESSTVVESLGTKEAIPEEVKEEMGEVSGISYNDLSYLTIPFYDLNGTVQKGHMIVHTKLADEVLLIFQELYNIKYPIESMNITDNFEESISGNNTSAFYNEDTLRKSKVEESQSLHTTGQAIDINPQINPIINSDDSYLPDNAEKYATERDEQEEWSDVEKDACIKQDSRITRIFEKYGWTWKGDASEGRDTSHFEKEDLSDVQTITGSLLDHVPSADDGEDDEETSILDDVNTDNNTSNDTTNNTTDNNSTGSITEDTENEQKRQEVKDYIDGYASKRGTWGVYAKALDSDVDIVDINKDAKMQSASVIKLFVMATVYDQRQKGDANAQNISDSTISSMITVSDNDATNSIITQLGGGNASSGMQIINQYIQDHGYTNTEINRLMLASTANGDNYTSPADAAKILEEIYNGTCVSQSASEAMLGFLKKQTRTSKIPAGVPSSVETANKTGELDTVQNDAAIVFKDGAPYVLVVMCSNVIDTNQVISDIVEISRMVYGLDSATLSSDEDVKTTINSKVIDLKYIPEEKFDEMLENDDESILEYYTLDGNWKLITAKWSYNSDSGVKFSKNSAINYMTTLQKYTTPFEYILDYYIDMEHDNWVNDFIDVAMQSEFIIAVQDNVTTTERQVTTTLEYADGEIGYVVSGTEVIENVSDTIELTYGDTWFVKFSKKDSYEAAALQSTSVATGTGANVTGDQGEYLGDYTTTAYCSVCNSPAGSTIGDHDNELIPNFSIAVHTYDPYLKSGDYVWIEGNIYRVDDNGGGITTGLWIDFYTEPDSAVNGPCCNYKDWANRTGVKVYRATNIREKTVADTEATTSKDGTKLINTVADLKGKVTDNTSTISSSEAGPTKTVVNDEGYYYVGSTRTTVTNTHTISYNYATGDYEVTGNEEKFIKLFEDNEGTKQLLKPEWLLENIEEGQRTAPFLDLTKYLLYKLTGYDYGVTTFDYVEKYTPGDFKSATKNGRISYASLNLTDEDREILYKITSAERGGGTQEQQEYVVSVILNRVLCSGFPNTVREVVFAPNQFEPVSNGAFDAAVPSDVTIAAVDNVIENGGTAKTAVYFMTPAAALRQDWLKNCIFLFNDEDDSLKDTNTSGTHNFYTNAQAQEELQQYMMSGSGDILEACETIMNMFLERNAHYSLNFNDSTGLRDGDIETVYNSDTKLCCATYTSLVLYEAGLLTADQINAYSYNWTGEDNGVPAMLLAAGWTEVDKSDLQPGDILNKNGVHVVVYAGEGTIYDQTSCVVSSDGEKPLGGPISSGTYSYYMNDPGYKAYRAP